MAYKFTPTQGPLAPFLQTLGTGLEQVAQAKLGQLQENQLLNSLRSAGAPAENIELFRSLKGQPELQKNILQNPGFFGQQAAAPEAAINSMDPAQQLPQKNTAANLLQSPQQAREAKRDIREDKTFELKNQNAIEKQNKSFRDDLREAYTGASPVLKVTNEIKELIDRPDIQWGAIKSLTPTRFQNEATQALISKFNELVLAKAQLGKGVPSRMRLSLEELAKPNLSLNKSTAQYLINSINEGAQDVATEKNIENQIIEKYGKEPKNLEQLVKKYSSKAKTLEPASNYPDGTIAEDGKIKFITKDGEWEIYGI